MLSRSSARIAARAQSHPAHAQRCRIVQNQLLAREAGRDSRVFQNKSVFEILDIVFGAYRGQGKLVP
ncbi:uncharacterized protein involved in type VI secretion and phage assembly, partial [Oxalobacteraceae bacterium GrIS 1.11]